jgi:hypothetical protein
MGVMADRLDSMVVRAVSPDRKIEATVVSRDQVSLRFGAGTYRRYDERTLEHQLARLATLVWVEYRRGYFQALSEATGETIRGDEPEEDLQRRRFRQAQAEMVVRGVSAGGLIEVESTGLAQWRVTLERGITRRLTEEQFLSEARGAVAALLADYYMKMVSLKDEFYDLEIPDRQRR